ncbi:MAG: hypothetical protein IPL10_06845 [Bacteroidetes bacterium]|jgi:hypothetical protein|nr:hypothetical protein [Bacteroidota bacterium]
MKQLFFLASLISLACISCKSKKEAAKVTETAPVASTSAAPEAPIVYRLLVSFISKGAGPDSEKRTAFLAYVDAHPSKPAYKTVNWGREGEIDYCFNLSELSSKKDMIAFIESVRKIAAGSDRIIVNENAECQHKAR